MCKREDLFVLIIADSKLASDSSVCLFIIDPYYKKSGDIRGLSYPSLVLVGICTQKVVAGVPMQVFFLSLECHLFGSRQFNDY